MKLKYSSNNSGGSWWLSDKDWYALEKAGWVIDWYSDHIGNGIGDYPTGRFLGALASHAYKSVESKAEATLGVEEFERLTGKTVTDEGCSCCGPPHYFSLYDEDDNYISSFDTSPKYTQYTRDWTF